MKNKWYSILPADWMQPQIKSIIPDQGNHIGRLHEGDSRNFSWIDGHVSR